MDKKSDKGFGHEIICWRNIRVMIQGMIELGYDIVHRTEMLAGSSCIQALLKPFNFL
jgi:hypothetical protein